MRFNRSAYLLALPGSVSVSNFFRNASICSLLFFHPVPRRPLGRRDCLYTLHQITLSVLSKYIEPNRPRRAIRFSMSLPCRPRLLAIRFADHRERFRVVHHPVEVTAADFLFNRLAVEVRREDGPFPLPPLQYEK